MASYSVSQPIQNIFESMSMRELHRTKKILDNIIKAKTPSDRKFISSLDINDFVEFQHDFLSDEEARGINKDFNAANYLYLQDKNQKTKSLWLSRTDKSYEWTSELSGKVTKNLAIPISNYKNIEALMGRINKSLNCDLNSCLIQFYTSGESGLRLHNDFEDTMDPEQPIVVVSSGVTREIQFLHNYQSSSEAPIKIINASNGSIYIMKAKCQEYFRHRVPPNKSCNLTRFSLSFRRITTPPKYELCSKPLLIPNSQSASVDPSVDPSVDVAEKSPVKPHISYFETLAKTDQGNSSTQPNIVHNQPRQPIPKKSITPQNTVKQHSQSRDIVVLFGTSMTRWVDSNLLSDDSVEFINCSKSGAFINHFPAMLDNFAETNSDRVSHVRQIIFSIGTNDIKIHRQDIGRFKKSICQLVTKARKIFGEHVNIHFQSTLPMRNLYTYTIDNFIGFNNLLKEICKELYCCYFDCFNEFLDYEHYDHNKYLFADHLHLNRRGYAVLQNCLASIINVDRNIIFAPSYSCYL